ncbi:unnamed protein product [Parascedosporium putredinis]|uniref:F-box domain-containing protein n=1 Tax=Parascedosporium putredinis TaxID=1442378 RepID=A0A9P1H1M2_9PEZI|nr:unnamed protein product [Parascedosporium putredinis]CAI7992892.1 unnamed protein product [Parascedosporium putredinis]
MLFGGGFIEGYSWGGSGFSGRRGSASHDFEEQFRYQRTGNTPPPTSASARALAHLPNAALDRIFYFVCPQSLDESYDTCEQSFVEDSCSLCDVRDLAHCVQVCKAWRPAARALLYHSIRIDSVHYCEREAFLAERRKRRTFFDRNGEPEDTAHARLKLLCRTLRDDPTRLGARADLARTIAVLPNLRYVDLPEGLFSDDPSFSTLRLEVQARCADLRKMTYLAGAERSIELLARGNVWRNLEVLELIKLNIDPVILRHVLGALGNLRALKITEMRSFSDEVFAFNENLPHFPALLELILKKTPRVTEAGLAEYLSRPDAGSALRVLSLWRTGVKPTRVQDVLEHAINLKTLSIHDTVDSAIPSGAGLKRITSRSLQTISSNNPFAGTGSLTRTLEVFTKSDEGMDWSFVKVQPIHGGGGGFGPSSRFGGGGRRGSQSQRPTSGYGLGTDITGMGWNTGAARRSVMVGNGTGGFLAIPSDNGDTSRDDVEEWPRPKSSAGEKGDRDLWR